MAEIKEIKKAIKIIENYHKKSLLHCVSIIQSDKRQFKELIPKNL